MASTSRSEAQARSRSDLPARPTSSVFPQHTPDAVDNAVSYPNFVRSTLPSTDPTPEANAPLLLVPSKPTQEEEPTLPDEEEPKEPTPADEDTVDGELFRAARAARASVQPVRADPRAAILRFVERKKQEAESGLSTAPILRGVVARPARKRRKIVDAPTQEQRSEQRKELEERGRLEAESKSVEVKKEEEGKDVEPVAVKRARSDESSKEEPFAAEKSNGEEKDKSKAPGELKDSQTDQLFAYSSSEDEKDEDDDQVS